MMRSLIASILPWKTSSSSQLKKNLNWPALELERKKFQEQEELKQQQEQEKSKSNAGPTWELYLGTGAKDSCNIYFDKSSIVTVGPRKKRVWEKLDISNAECLRSPIEACKKSGAVVKGIENAVEDSCIAFVTLFNEFINHEPKPFRPMIDRDFKL